MTRTVLLGDICNISIGRTPPRKEQHWFSVSDGVKWVSIKDMGNSGKYINSTSEYLSQESISKFRIPIIKAGTLMLSFKLTVGRLGFAGEDMTSNEAIAQLRIKNSSDVNKEWLYYYLKNFNYNSLSSTSSIATAVNSKTINNLPVNIPGIEFQKKIADILGTIDEKIDLNRKMNETLEQMGQALFKKYFITNPEAMGWDVKYIDAEINIKYGKNLPTNKLNHSGYPVYGGNGLIGFFDKYIYENPMVLVACRGAASGDINISEPKSFVTNNSLVLEIKNSSSLTFEYLRFYSQNREGGYHQFVTGSAQPQITVDSLRKCKIVVPHSGTIQHFTVIAKELVFKINSNDSEIQALVNLRDALLPRLISGKIKI